MEEDVDGYEKDLRPNDMVAEEDAQYESEDEHHERKQKEKPVGPPLELEIPLRPPPGRPDRVMTSIYLNVVNLIQGTIFICGYKWIPMVIQRIISCQLI